MATAFDLRPTGGNPERIAAELGSLGSVTLVALRGDEGLTTCFTYEGRARVHIAIETGGAAAVRPERIAGDWTTFTLRDALGSERKVRGLVTEAEVEIHDLTGGRLGAAEASI